MTDRITEEDIEVAWRKARPISGRASALYRIAPDVIQSVIRRDRYDVRGEYGWRIEYGRPVAFREVTTESAIRTLEFENMQTGGRGSAGHRGSGS